MGKFSVKDIMNAPAPAEPETTTEIQLRTLDLITAEINYYKQQTVQNIIEIGKRLIEAKDRLQHGEWVAWLKNRVDFSERTAQNFMKIASEYSNPQPVADLPYTKLLALLQVPAEDREEFLAESHVVNGEEKAVADMSKRELEQAIKERDAAEKRAAEAEKKAQENELHYKNVNDSYKRLEEVNHKHYLESQEWQKKAESSQKKLDEIGRVADERYKTMLQLQRRLRELESKPIDVAVAEPSEEQLAGIRKEVEDQAACEAEQLRQEIARLKNQAATFGVPEERTEDATDAFCDSVSSVFGQYNAILQCSKPSAVSAYIEEAITVLDELRDKLKQAQVRAENLALADEDVDLPEDLQ